MPDTPFTVRRLAAGAPPPVVAVLRGGPSREHDISLKTGGAIIDALRAAGWPVHDCTFHAAALPPIPADTQVVVPALHGIFGEDGEVARLLEERGLPYIGSPPAASACMIDKELTKQALRRAGIPVPRGCLLGDADSPRPADLPLPLIVKPNCDGSTVGLTLVEDDAAWPAALQEAMMNGQPALVEQYLPGVECTVGLIDGAALPVVEIRPPGAIYTMDAKYVYKHGRTQYFCPPERLDVATQARLQDLAAAAYRALGARDLLRIDFRLDAAGAPHVLEANNMPGFTSTSLLPKAAAAVGVDFTMLCQHLVLTALARA